MKYEDYIGIETPIYQKFQNKMIPEIVVVIKEYLFNHPEKLSLYLDESIKIEDILKYISSYPRLLENQEIEPKDMLEVIQEFVEGKQC